MTEPAPLDPVPVTEEELAELVALAAAATPGPWYVHTSADERSEGEQAEDVVAVSAVRPTQRGGPWPESDPAEVVAVTLGRGPHRADGGDGRWKENAFFISAARNAVPLLAEEVRRLRALLAEREQREQRAQSAERNGS
ncbi:hypothetical protein AB0F71_29635 [Kitasatospora sp. NPDC028055]|uniref:hypothetical protein n=1 Tax=Kitasatospora sp. NPDC028055 TaxID=3155653 RepID=UPI0034030DD6